MARPLRIEYEGAVYHITARGNERRKIYFSKEDYGKFLNNIAEAKKKFGIQLHCYTLMSNHYHLIIETPEANLSRAMHYISSSYTTYINRKKKRSGHLFQGRYKAIVVSKDSYLLELSRYIHLNPVRAKMVQKPEEYPYSSYRAYISKAKDDLLSRELILGLMDSRKESSTRAYRKHVESATESKLEDPSKKVYGGIILGTNEFIKETLKRIKDEYLKKDEISNKRQLKTSYEAEEIIGAVAGYYKTDIGSLINRRNRQQRKVAIHLLKKHTGMTNRAIGEVFSGLSHSAISRVNERFQRQLEKERRLRKEIEQIEKIM